MHEQAYLAGRAAEKDEAMASIWGILNLLEVERHNPDQWERLCLVRAFRGLFSGCYGLACAEARLAGVQPKKRVPSSQLPADPIATRADLPFLFKVARAAQEEPVRRFPHLGPVVVTTP